MQVSNLLQTMRVRLSLVTLAALSMVSYASAAAINWTPITEIITGLVDFLPNLIDLIVGMVPIIIVLAIVGFIVAFLDKILAMLKI